MQGLLYQINISRGGIPKHAVPEAIVTVDGIQGDSWAHPSIHGGKNQALLLISLEDIDYLEQLGYDVYPGALGENLTTTGIDMRQVRFGDRFRVGELLLEITKLRRPCRTLDAIRKDIQNELQEKTPGSPAWGRGGFYAKVIEPASIHKGAIIAKADNDVQPEACSER